MNNRQTLLRIFFVLFFFGIISLLALVSRPTLTNIRAVDMLHLIGTGMCFGGSIVSLVVYFRRRQ